jgi:hypothetical protein
MSLVKNKTKTVFSSLDDYKLRYILVPFTGVRCDMPEYIKRTRLVLSPLFTVNLILLFHSIQCVYVAVLIVNCDMYLIVKYK